MLGKDQHLELVRIELAPLNHAVGDIFKLQADRANRTMPDKMVFPLGLQGPIQTSWRIAFAVGDPSAVGAVTEARINVGGLGRGE